jgi:hypothetical protein
MARRNSTDDIPEEMVPIDTVAVKSGFPIEVVRNKLEQSEIGELWDHTPAIRASRATEILDELLAAAEANNRWNRENIDAQIEELQSSAFSGQPRSCQCVPPPELALQAGGRRFESHRLHSP